MTTINYEHFWQLDDRERGIEWIYPGFRFGIIIDPDTSQSSWYLVSNEKFGNLAMSGYLDDHS